MSRAADIVVIGAGPAGSSAAYHAARAGARVTLIDRVSFPRPKTCGDVLMPEAVAAIRRMGVSPTLGRPILGARFVHAGTGEQGYESLQEGEPHLALAISRRALDAVLLDRAIEAGAEFHVGDVERLLFGPSGRVRGVELRASTGKRTSIHGRVLAATGAGRPQFLRPLLARRALPRVRGLAGRFYVRTSIPAGDLLELYFPLSEDERIIPGYGWVFPIEDNRINVGVGIYQTRDAASVSLRNLIGRFVSWRQGADPRLQHARRDEPLRTWRLPVEPGPTSLSGVLFAGDLCGLANPFTGEGIGAALVTGELAAAAFVQAKVEPDVAYGRAIATRFERVLRLQPLVADVYRRSEFFLGRGYDLLVRSDRLAARTVRNILWEQGAPSASPFASRVDSAKERARELLLDIARSMRAGPFAHAFLRELMTLPEVEFGRFTAAAGQDPQAGALDAAQERILFIVDVIAFIRKLHADLPDTSADERARGEWGCDTLAVALADMLNAIVLREMTRLKRDAIEELADLARDAMSDPRGQGASRNLDARLHAYVARWMRRSGAVVMRARVGAALR